MLLAYAMFSGRFTEALLRVMEAWLVCGGREREMEGKKRGQFKERFSYDEQNWLSCSAI